MFSVKDLLVFLFFLCFFNAVVFYFAWDIGSTPPGGKGLKCPGFFLFCLKFHFFHAFLWFFFQELDVVYTWVNGSDPVHLKNLKKLKDADNFDDGVTRYREYHTLRYSMRSVYYLLKNVRYIHLIIADDEALPIWLESSHPMIRIVRHSDIMPKSALPTFNSNAIETNMHLIPGLATCFFYLNDDVLFARAQPSLSNYFDEFRGIQRVHLSPWKTPWKEKMETSTWHMSVANSNSRLNNIYGTEERNYPDHGCHFFHLEVFKRQRSLFDESYKETLHSKFRTENDDVVSFLYPHVAIKEFGAVKTDYELMFTELKSNPSQNIEMLRHIGFFSLLHFSVLFYLSMLIVRRKPICVCMNDGLDPEGGESAIVEMMQAFETLLPHPAPWERLDKVPKLPPFSRVYFSGSGLLELAFKMLVAAPVVVCCILLLACCIIVSARRGSQSSRIKYLND